jgi:acetyl-CoA carboxylase biotin carboxyl carrier protein
VDSIEISTDKGLRIRLSKTPAGRPAAVLASPAAVPVVAELPRITPPGGVPAVESTPTPQSSPAVPPPAAEKLLEVKSPMVGTYYGAPEPGAKPYVTPGARVKKGQVLCIIEAMKIMNEIESEVDGVIREILAENAHPVEYGQVLFRVDPHG